MATTNTGNKVNEIASHFQKRYLLDQVHANYQDLQKYIKTCSVRLVRVLFKIMRDNEADEERENYFIPHMRCTTGEFAALHLLKPYPTS
jgi:uncharacterized membrane-anchored protein YhcB (DUF1043 family)